MARREAARDTLLMYSLTRLLRDRRRSVNAGNGAGESLCCPRSLACVSGHLQYFEVPVDGTVIRFEGTVVPANYSVRLKVALLALLPAVQLGAQKLPPVR